MTTPDAQPELIGAAPPPVRRDAMVITWLVGVAMSAFGDAVWIVALAWTAAHTLAPAIAGVVIGIEMFPQAVLILVGGVIADRGIHAGCSSPARSLAPGSGAGALAWHSGYDGAPTLSPSRCPFGVVAGLTIPAGAALVRQVVNPDDYGTVMGWNQVSGRVMRLLGAPTGGILVAGVAGGRDAGRRRDVRGDRPGARAGGEGEVPPAAGGARPLA